MEESTCDRYVEDVKKTLEEAKIASSSLNPLTQILKFTVNEPDYLCLELNNDLQKAFDSGQSLVIRGDLEDSAVLCTENKTYDLKNTETSNSLLIMKTLKFPKDIKSLQVSSDIERTVEVQIVDKLVHNYLEPRLCRPRLQIVSKVLSKRLFKGPERETDFTQDLYSFEKLLGIVQASEEEIKSELEDLNAIEYKGYWRLMDFEYHFRVFSFITAFIEQESVSLDKIDLESCCTAHETIVPRVIFEQVLRYYTSSSSEYPGFYALKRDKVCRMVAESILKAAKKFNLSDFLPVWQESVIPGLVTRLDQLTGIVVVETNSSPPAIWYFPERDLPEDVNERLQKLFQERNSWSMDDIVPYMQKLATPQLPVNALLAKYARMSTKDGVKYFTGRHLK